MAEIFRENRVERGSTFMGIFKAGVIEMVTFAQAVKE